MREKHGSAASHTLPDWRLNLQPKHVPWTGNQTSDLLVCGIVPNKLGRTGQGHYLNLYNHYRRFNVGIRASLNVGEEVWKGSHRVAEAGVTTQPEALVCMEKLPFAGQSELCPSGCQSLSLTRAVVRSEMLSSLCLCPSPLLTTVKLPPCLAAIPWVNKGLCFISTLQILHERQGVV